MRGAFYRGLVSRVRTSVPSPLLQAPSVPSIALPRVPRTSMEFTDRAPARPGSTTIAAAATAAAVSAATTALPQISSTVWEVGGLPTEVLELPAAGGQAQAAASGLTVLPLACAT